MEPTTWTAQITQALERRDLTAALALALAAVRDPDADPARAHALAGTLAAALGQPATARPHLERAVALDVPDADAFAQLAWLERDAAPDRALALVERALALGADAAWHHALHGELALREGGAPADAVSAFAAAAARATRADERGAALARGLAAAAAAGDDAHVLDAATALAALDGARLEALLDGAAAAVGLEERRMDALADAPGDPVARLVERARAMALGGPAEGPARRMAARHARCRFDLAAARAELDAALALAPEDAEARELRLGLDLLEGRADEVEATLFAALDAGAAPAVDFFLALADTWRRRDAVPRALAAAEAATRVDPAHAGAWIEVARLRAAVGREREAGEALGRAAALDPEVDVEAGRAHESLRVFGEALPALVGAATGHRLAEVVRVRFGHNAMVVQARVDDGATVYAKAFLPGRREVAHVEATARLMEAVTGTVRGLAVPRPLALPEGTFARRCAGGPAYVMTEVPGRSLRRELAHPRATLTVGHAEALGGALAELHRGLAQIDGWTRADTGGMASGLGVFARWGRGEGDVAGEARALGLGGHRREVAAVVAKVAPLVAPVAATLAETPRGIIHGDFGWHNVTWEGARVVAAIDFDYATVDYPVADLLNAIHRTAFDWGRLLSHGDPAPRAEVARGIWEGYGAAGGTLPAEDAVDALFAAVRVRYYLAMATTGAAAGDPRSPRTYNQARDSLDVLAGQLGWLARRGGLGALLG